MNVLFHSDAELEFNAAIDYYEAIENGLGYDFSLEIANALRELLLSRKHGQSLKTTSEDAW